MRFLITMSVIIIAFFRIQYRIAKRGLEMLNVGGKMVYSTCSLNPLENEAVLHRLLMETNNSVQLVDGRDFVPGLKCNPGLYYISDYFLIILKIHSYKYLILFHSNYYNVIYIRIDQLATGFEEFTVLQNVGRSS